MDEDEKSIALWSAVAGFVGWVGFYLASAKSNAEKQAVRAAEDAKLRYEHLIESSGDASSCEVSEE